MMEAMLGPVRRALLAMYAVGDCGGGRDIMLAVDA